MVARSIRRRAEALVVLAMAGTLAIVAQPQASRAAGMVAADLVVAYGTLSDGGTFRVVIDDETDAGREIARSCTVVNANPTASSTLLLVTFYSGSRERGPLLLTPQTASSIVNSSDLGVGPVSEVLIDNDTSPAGGGTVDYEIVCPIEL